MKKTLLLMLLIPFVQFVSAQKYITKNGHVKFYSETPMENIEANNNQVNCALDISNGNFVFKILIKSFEFPKALMQEHFNENYMESDKIPTATFSGTVVNFNGIDFTKDGTYDVTVKGKLNIHGVTKEVEQSGSFVIMGDDIMVKSVFHVKPADYDIKIAAAVVDKIADEIEVSVDVNLNKMK
jgi:polyisoprenoid-binding protein YceI